MKLKKSYDTSFYYLSPKMTVMDIEDSIRRSNENGYSLKFVIDHGDMKIFIMEKIFLDEIED